MKITKIPEKWQQIAAYCLVILPAIAVGYLISHNSVNVPFNDQWDNAAVVINKFSDGTLSFADLIAQHNESRKFFPRLIFLGLAYLTNWDVRYEMVLIFLLACIVSFNIFLLMRHTVQKPGLLPNFRLMAINIENNPVSLLALAFLANLLIFSPIQHENWLWGIQVVVFIPIACITTSLVITYSPLNSLTKFTLSALLATFSTFSYANGLLCWVVLLPALALAKSWPEFWQKKWLITGWIAGFAANTALYFYDYHKPQGHPSLAIGLDSIGKLVQYFLSFLGGGLGLYVADKGLNQVLAATTTIGGVIIFLFAGVVAYILWHWRDNLLLQNAAGWLVIAAYTIISGLITAAGRVGFGIEQSLSPRYTTFSLYLIVSLIPLLAIISHHWQNQVKYRQIITKIAAVFLVTLLLWLQFHSFAYATHQMQWMRQSRLQGKACLMLANIQFHHQCLQQNVYLILNPDNNYVVNRRFYNRINKLDKLGFLQPRLISSRNIKEIAAPTSPSNSGWLDEMGPEDAGNYTVRGWAFLPARQEPADAIILTYEIAGQEPTIFEFNNGWFHRPDVAAQIGYHKDDRFLGWSAQFTASQLPPGEVKITAWALDATTGKAFQLEGQKIINNSKN